jgi:energy-coupling factor transporter ATP-binding protein EcfA2
MLELRNVHKRFRGIVAVDDVSFSARAGEVTGYLGPNGSGKSTTMKMITGLIEMTSGSILFEGVPIQRDLIGYKQRSLQIAAFCLLLSVYFLQPSMLTPEALTAPQNQRLLARLPPYWFLGLFQTLNGSPHPALDPLARRAAAGLAIAVSGAGAAFALSYLRTLRKIVEEPDIATGAHGGRWLPRFGDPPLTAMVHFNIRTLLRSRQHRLILSFFLGLAFTIVILYVKTPLAQRTLLNASASNPWRQINAPLLVCSIVMMWFAVIGTRVAFAMPTDLRANWIFRMTNARSVADGLKATRRSLFALAVVPVGTIWAAVLLWLWPWRPAVGHIFVLGFVGTILVEVCLHNFHKIPFTCSYLPGKANVYYLFFAYALLSVALLDRAAVLERNALQGGLPFMTVLLVLSFSAVLARLRTVSLSQFEGADLRFEEVEPPAVLELG